MQKQLYPVQLQRKERSSLLHLCKKGSVEVRVYKRARALLLAHEGLKDQEIAPQVGLSRITLVNLRRRFQQEHLQCIHDRPRSGRKPRFDGVLRAKITALACSDPPEGYGRWSLRLLADRVVELGWVEGIHFDTVGRILKKTNFNLTRSEAGVQVSWTGASWPGWSTGCTYTPSPMTLRIPWSALTNGPAS